MSKKKKLLLTVASLLLLGGGIGFGIILAGGYAGAAAILGLVGAITAVGVGLGMGIGIQSAAHKAKTKSVTRKSGKFIKKIEQDEKYNEGNENFKSKKFKLSSEKKIRLIKKLNNFKLKFPKYCVSALPEKIPVYNGADKNGKYINLRNRLESISNLKQNTTNKKSNKKLEKQERKLDKEVQTFSTRKVSGIPVVWTKEYRLPGGQAYKNHTIEIGCMLNSTKTEFEKTSKSFMPSKEKGFYVSCTYRNAFAANAARNFIGEKSINPDQVKDIVNIEPNGQEVSTYSIVPNKTEYKKALVILLNEAKIHYEAWELIVSAMGKSEHEAENSFFPINLRLDEVKSFGHDAISKDKSLGLESDYLIKNYESLNNILDDWKAQVQNEESNTL